MKDKTPPIKDWTNERVNKIFDYHLDDMHPLDRLTASDKYTTVEQKRNFLIEEEKKFVESFK